MIQLGACISSHISSKIGEGDNMIENVLLVLI